MRGKNFKILVLLLIFLFCSFQSLFSQAITGETESEPKIELGLPLGHTGSVYDVDYSPDGKYIASGSSDETIKIWDVETGKCLKTLKGHESNVFSIDYSPDGKFIASGSGDATIKIWNVKTGSCLKTLKGNSSMVYSVTYSSDGRFIAGSFNNTIQVWSTKTYSCIKTLKGYCKHEIINTVIFSPDNHYLASCCGDNTVIIWHIPRGVIIKTFDADIINDLTSIETKIAYSPDGKYIASLRGDDTIKILDIMKEECLFTLKRSDEAMSTIAYSQNGNYIAVGGSGKNIEIWNIKNKELIHTFECRNDIIYTLSFSPDGKHLASAGNNNSITIWDMDRYLSVKQLEGNNKKINSVALSADGRFIATGNNNNLRLWNLEGGICDTIREEKKYEITSLAFSPIKNILAIGNKKNTVTLLDVESGISNTILNNTLKNTPSFYINSLSFSLKNNLLACGSNATLTTYGYINLWDFNRNIIKHTIYNAGDLFSTPLDFSPHKDSLEFSFSSSIKLKIFDINNNSYTAMNELHYSTISTICYSPDGNFIASGSFDKTIKIWDVETRNCLKTLKGHSSGILSIAYSPDGSFLASGGRDKTIRIWDIATGACLKTLTGHSRAVTSVAYSPDGRFLTSGSKDTSVKIWDASSGKCLATLYSFGDDDWSVTTPEGLFDASAGAMKKMYFVQGLEMIELEQLKDRYYEPGLLAKIMGYNEEGITIDPEKLPERVKLYPEIDALVMADTLRVKLMPREGGIGKVRVAINGKEIADDVLGNRGAGNYARTENSGAVYLTVPLKNHPNLVPGEENEISVYAYEEGNWLKSRPVVCTYRTEPVDTTLIPKVHIIASGISDYTGSNIDLNFAAKDAEDIAYALSLGAKKLFGTDKTEVHLLTAGKDESRYGFQNREPTKENIRGAIEEVAEKANSTDIVIIYLSGHGISYGSDPGDFYYLTKEAKSSRASTYSDPVIRRNASISSTELIELVKQVPANRQVLIIDTCASGQVVDNLLANRDISSSTVRALDRMKDRTGMFILTGSAADAVSYEASSFGQGVLTYSILEGIKGAALRDNSYIDVMTLFIRAQERVPQLAEHLGGIQRPEVFAQNRLGSFDIGMVTPEEQEKVPLARPRPVFIQSNFQDEYVPRDIIDLGKYVDEELKRRAEQGRYSDCVFVPVRDYPHAYSLGGRYERKEEGFTLKAGLFEGDKPMDTFTITAKDAATLAYQLVEQALRTANAK